MNEGLLLKLFGPGWPGVRTASGRLVVPSEPNESPWATVITGDNHRVIPRDQVEAKAFEVAVVWLGKLRGEWAATGEGKLAILNPWAAEFLLDPPRLQLACARLESGKLLASVPMRGRITVMVDTVRHRRQMFAETQAGFENAGGDRVCRFPFLIESGRLTGLVKVPPAEDKAWWKIW